MPAIIVCLSLQCGRARRIVSIDKNKTPLLYTETTGAASEKAKEK
jgi:hypothetical protein